MLTVERQPNTQADRYIVRSKEPGFGRGWKVKDLTLAEAQRALEHYFRGHGGEGAPGCALCREARA